LSRWLGTKLSYRDPLLKIRVKKISKDPNLRAILGGGGGGGGVVGVVVGLVGGGGGGGGGVVVKLGKKVGFCGGGGFFVVCNIQLGLRPNKNSPGLKEKNSQK